LATGLIWERSTDMKQTRLKRLPIKNAEDILRRLEDLKKQIDDICKEIESIRVEDIKNQI